MPEYPKNPHNPSEMQGNTQMPRGYTPYGQKPEQYRGTPQRPAATGYHPYAPQAERPMRKLTPDQRGVGQAGQVNTERRQFAPYTPPASTNAAYGGQNPYARPTHTPQETERKQVEYHPMPTQKKSGIGFLQALLLLISCVSISVTASFFIAQRMLHNAQEELAAVIAEFFLSALPEMPELSGANILSAEDIYALGRRQAVTISAEVGTGNTSGERRSASGFIFSTDGYILTNYHVIEDAREITVTLGDGRTFAAEFIGGEGALSDIAVLHIDATSLEAATLGDSTRLLEGDRIFAVGNPLGQEHIITSGEIRALHREVTIGDGLSIGMIQISAAVNAGNSGGPVYNEQGEVIALVTAKSALDSGEQAGFAISIQDAMFWVESILSARNGAGGTENAETADTQDGDVSAERAVLGIRSADMPAGFESWNGVYIAHVYQYSTAYLGGMRSGDIITVFNDEPIRNLDELLLELEDISVGAVAETLVYRAGSGIVRLDIRILA